MDIIAFVKKLVSSFGKKDVREKVRMIKNRLTTTVLVSIGLIEQANEYDEDKFQSSYGVGFLKSFLGMIPKNKLVRTNPYLSLLKICSVNAVALLDLLDEYVDKQLDETIQIEGITYQKSTVLRLIELLDFYTDYAMRQLSSLVACETNISAFQRPDGKPFSKREEEYLASNQVAFFRMMELLVNDPKKILSTVIHITDTIVIGDQSAMTRATADDPLRLQFIPVVSDFLLWRGKRQVDRDMALLDRSVREERNIRMRLEALRQYQASGHSDARTETVINNYERQLTLVRSEIDTLNKKAGV